MMNYENFSLPKQSIEMKIDDHTIAVDFDGYIDEAQPLIYRKMIEFRKK